jgi:hypothetical protein
MVKVPISIGELFDKLSILEIKLRRIDDRKKTANIYKELKLLHKIAIKLDPNYSKDTHYKKLEKINAELWSIEIFKRQCEKEKYFGFDFIKSARDVYIFNDKRAALKKAINKKYNSEITEEKSYK